jgi:hypothetical protein
MIWLLAYLTLSLATAFWLRQRFAVFQRLNDLNWQALVTLDVVAAFAIFWPLYLVKLLKERPLPWATISATCGYYARDNRLWAQTAELAIDGVFLALTSQSNHCRKAYEKWRAPLDGVNA